MMRKIRWKKIFAVCLTALGTVAGAVTVGSRPVRDAWAPARLPGRQLILDAGHGGEDGGAVSVTGAAESGINLEVVRRMDQLLGFCGTPPILLREKDISLYDKGCKTLREKKVSDIRNRVAAVERTPNALLVSIHQNTYADPAYHGAQVFYREEGESLALARVVQAFLREGTDRENERAPARIPPTVYLMGHISCPAVLVECGFLSNPAEEAKLRTGEYQTKLALCIAAGVLKYGREGGTMQS